jgi:hypothetical protein
MGERGKPEKMKDGIHCQRCQGKMAFEKFYGQSGSFCGWRCPMCGEVLDPVILLHRLSHDANVTIPDDQKEMMSVIKKYLGSARPKWMMPSLSRSRRMSPGTWKRD